MPPGSRNLPATRAGKTDVGNDYVGIELGELDECFSAIVRTAHFIAHIFK